MDFFGIGIGELILIIIVALIVIGPAKIPGMARTLGRTINSLKKASGDLTSQINKELEAEELGKSGAKNAPAEKLPSSPANETRAAPSGGIAKADPGKAEPV
jgi:Tat protein translocase TatB subunit